jgi:hypothetical protein
LAPLGQAQRKLVAEALEEARSGLQV